ncbi:uncharacterized protein Z520_11113 [Fonsecaea multimorphosa CBS 102226]|uniref:Coenzyme Q-binding protein COQ10 START domain-containing protein n=1 Tax=Fonsecaea multimorphosa CBS 102226 TaxID=1442371 RepID=A0A0D2JJ89_9EURO|nr:uncharacterized protein Z520_11113 [Fonsecaea multimorphosa CBS 102226]KIX93257.1 hypothetical protein Z520_11113 [Fonsecaea multimorphosa CBS 102226]OAL18487.1 hypothetical protein AYO22_10683 [Fonsecaea multimorphosa]
MPALSSIVIDAPPQDVWNVLVDLQSWPDWNTWFLSMRAHSTPLELGTLVTFTNRMSDTAKPGVYTTRITTWKPEATEFAWKGGPMPQWLGWIVRGYHWFRLVAQDDGRTTLFDHGEDVEGLLSVLVPDSMVQDLVKQLEKFNSELKRRVEEGPKATAT